jgi:uncharacterized protein
MRRWACLAVLLLVWVAGCGAQTPLEALILRPLFTMPKTPTDYGYQYQEYSVPVAEDRSVVVWHVPTDQSKALAVVIPGNTFDKSWYTMALPVLADNGYDMLFMDYEGFGNSPGVATLQHTIDDALAVVKHAQTLHPKVVLFGPSLGSPPAVRAAAEYNVTALMLEGSLILGQEPGLWLEQNHLGFPPIAAASDWFVQAQLPEGYDILKYIALVDAPKLIIHSTEDTVVPFVSGQMVYAAASEPKTFVEERYDHGKMVVMEPKVYTQTMVGWLDAVIGQQ